MTGILNSSFIFCKISSPLSIPGPRCEFTELRLALSKDVLKTYCISRVFVISRVFSATSRQRSRFSAIHGPPMRVSFSPIVIGPKEKL